MSNGIFILESSEPSEEDDQGRKFVRVTALLSFETDPVQVAGTSVPLTPATIPGQGVGSALHDLAKLHLNAAAGVDLVAKFDAGEAVYQVVQVQVEYPIAPSRDLPVLQAMWQQMWDHGQTIIGRERFAHAGTWVPMTPDKPAPPDLNGPAAAAEAKLQKR